VLTATALWLCNPALVLALDEHLGAPVDSYVNGSQTWFTGDDQRLEWRLHPVAEFRAPAGLSHYDLWDAVVDALAGGAATGDALTLGGDQRPLESVWDGLECFAADDDDLEPATISRRAIDTLGAAPDLVGLVDHEIIGDAWESTGGKISIVALLRSQLEQS
jgi:hypothetical protein